MQFVCDNFGCFHFDSICVEQDKDTRWCPACGQEGVPLAYKEGLITSKFEGWLLGFEVDDDKLEVSLWEDDVVLTDVKKTMSEK